MHSQAAEQIVLPGSRALQADQALPMLRAEDLVREAEAQRALAELFPHLKLDALRAIQDLFPLHARVREQRGGARH